MSKIVLIVGASGLVGSELVKKLVSYENDKVIVLVRKPLEITYQNLEQKTVNFDNLGAISLDCEIDELYCALGTTIKKAKTKENFYKVDFEYSLESAKLALRHRAKSIALISAIGANSKSIFFYNKVKGLLEKSIENQNWQKIVFVRPSFILGKRKEVRFLENFGKKIFLFFSPLIKMVSSKYRAVEAEEIAEKTINELRSNNQYKKRVVYF